MAVLIVSGGEAQSGSGSGDIDGQNIGTVAYDASNQRTGGECWKFVSGGGAASVYFFHVGLAAGATIYGRVFFKKTANPAAASKILFNSDSGYYVRMETNGTLTLRDSLDVQQGSASSATPSGSYFCVEMRTKIVVGSGDEVEFRLDGVSVSNQTGLSVSDAAPGQFQFGWLTDPGAAGPTLYADDFVMYDGSGAANNTWPGTTSKVLLMKPSSDSQIGLWTGGALGTTNLFEALNNTPPIGTAAETDLTQIENTVNNTAAAATNEYRGNCGSYTTAGVGSADTVNSIVAWTNHGEDVATGTKTGSFGFQANPAVAYTTFTFGNDVTLLGTYPSNWVWTKSTTDAPAPTLGSNLILGLRKTDTGTRVAAVDALMAYVEYTPAVTATAFPFQPYLRSSSLYLR